MVQSASRNTRLSISDNRNYMCLFRHFCNNRILLIERAFMTLNLYEFDMIGFFQLLYWQRSIWAMHNKRRMAATQTAIPQNGRARFVRQMTKAKPKYFLMNVWWNRRTVWINQVIFIVIHIFTKTTFYLMTFFFLLLWLQSTSKLVPLKVAHVRR